MAGFIAGKHSSGRCGGSKEHAASRQTGVPAITRRVPDAVTRAGSGSPREAVAARSLQVFQARLDGAWSNPA